MTVDLITVSFFELEIQDCYILKKKKEKNCNISIMAAKRNLYDC